MKQIILILTLLSNFTHSESYELKAEKLEILGKTEKAFKICVQRRVPTFNKAKQQLNLKKSIFNKKTIELDKERQQAIEILLKSKKKSLKNLFLSNYTLCKKSSDLLDWFYNKNPYNNLMKEDYEKIEDVFKKIHILIETRQKVCGKEILSKIHPKLKTIYEMRKKSLLDISKSSLRVKKADDSLKNCKNLLLQGIEKVEEVDKL